MRSHIAMLLTLWFAVLGTGVVRHWHMVDHEASTPCGCASACETAPAPPEAPPQQHDDHCDLCVLLHQPLALDWRAPLLMSISAPAGMAASKPMNVVARTHVERIDCRGPPARRA